MRMVCHESLIVGMLTGNSRQFPPPIFTPKDLHIGHRLDRLTNVIVEPDGLVCQTEGHANDSVTVIGLVQPSLAIMHSCHTSMQPLRLSESSLTKSRS